MESRSLVPEYSIIKNVPEPEFKDKEYWYQIQYKKRKEKKRKEKTSNPDIAFAWVSTVYW